MSNSPIGLPIVRPLIGCIIKDVAGKLALLAHHMKTHRLPYPVIRHQNIAAHANILPWTSDAAFIAPSARVAGNVSLGHDTCIFYHTVVRNNHQLQKTVIGDHTVIMDRATVMGPTQIGRNSYIGIGSSLQCCEICDGVYLGHGVTVCFGAVVQNNAIVASGSTIAKDCRVYAGQLWAGVPAVKIADVTEQQSSRVDHLVHDQIQAGRAHVQALYDHLQKTEELDEKWLNEVMAQAESQQRDVSIHIPNEIPLEARRFLQPRVTIRNPQSKLTNVDTFSNTAPWLPSEHTKPIND